MAIPDAPPTVVTPVTGDAPDATLMEGQALTGQSITVKTEAGLFQHHAGPGAQAP